MKKIIKLMFCIFITNAMNSQELHVASGGEITTQPGTVLYVDNNVSVDAGATLTIKSDASKSASFIVTGNSNGNITYLRHVPNTDWYNISSPFEGQNIPDFVQNPDNAIAQSLDTDNYAIGYYKNDNSASKRWTYHNTVSTVEENRETLIDFNSGFGYSMKRTSAGDFNFTGTLNTSDVQVSIPTVSNGTHLWSSIGNPYPSFLPANNNANAVANLLENNINNLNPNFAFLYVWDGSSFVPVGHLDAALQLAPGQGFLVNAKSTSETFTFSKSLQNHNDGATTFYKNNNSIPTISLNLSNGSKNKSTKIKFLENATSGLDIGYDAGTYQDGVPTFSLDTHLVSNSEGINFTVQCLPTHLLLDNQVNIPLSVNASASETLTFSISTTSIDEGVDLYLEDTLNNTFTNLTEATYQTTIKDAIQGIGRFYLRNSNKSLSLDENSIGNTLNLYKSDNNTLRISGLVEQKSANVSLYTITGKKVFAKQFISQRVKDITLPSNLAAGIYFANVISDEVNYTKKIIIE